MVKSIVLILAFALLALPACQGDSSDSQADPTAGPTTVVDTALIHAAAAELVDRFQKNLKSELMTAISTRQAAGAIEVCRDIAPAVADSHSTGAWTIRRVSDKNRNPDNRATRDDMAILMGFADTAIAEPQFVLQPGHNADSLPVYRYYQPIYTQQLCLNCHGGMQTLAPGVYQAVKKAYPDDKAVGYSTGQLRGMFVVEAVWPDGEPYAKELTGE
jgi:hypothetical protein